MNRTILLLGTASIMLLLMALVPDPAFGGSPERSERRLRVAVELDEPATGIAELLDGGYDIETYDIRTRKVYLIVPERELESLRRLGLEPEVLEDGTATSLDDYLDETESDAAVSRVAADYPAIAQRFEYAYLTEEGRVVAGLKISDQVGSDEAEPRILIVSQHHARETMTPEVAVDMMDYLTLNYGTDPEVTEWVDRYQIYIIPCHNPDGTHHVFNVDDMWRKNRRDNGEGTYGVDPNRNYPYRWGPEGCEGSSSDPGDNRYHGPSAASEPETRGLMEIAQDVRPSIGLSYHTNGEYVIHPFGCGSGDLPDNPDRRIHRDTASTLAASLVNDDRDGYYRMGTASETIYTVDGDSDAWFHAAVGALGFTIEMNSTMTGIQPDYATWRDDIVQRNREGWMVLLRRMSGASVTGRVEDACTGLPLEAEIGVAEQFFNRFQDPRTTVPAHGFYHRILVPGEYTWYVDGAGYRRQEWPLGVGFAPVALDVRLVPEGSYGLEVRSLVVDDPDGDHDQRLDPGEEADLILTAVSTGESVTGVSATLSTGDPYLEILDGTASVPDLAAGEEGVSPDGFRVRAGADAPAGHVAGVTVTFAADESLCSAGGSADIPITRGLPFCPFEQETLDVDPGWTVTGPQDGWEYGPPNGSGSTGGPYEAYTGDNVYGTNLDGYYGILPGDFVLTSTPFDLGGLHDVELRFRRWLNNEPGYDPARIEVSVDGETWIEAWSGFGRDTSWEEYRIDLPDEVDGAQEVRIRFVLVQNGGMSRSGFFIDDISLCGTAVPYPGGELRYESFRVIEDDPDYGNADGQADPGETVAFAVSVRSLDTGPVDGVTAVLSSTDPGITIHDGAARFPEITAGGVAESIAPHFSFTAGPDCPSLVPFTIEIDRPGGTVDVSRFTFPVGSLLHGTLLSDDMEIDLGWQVTGPDNDGRWEWGEPRGDWYGGEPTNPDEDHTADPGQLCWVTSNLPAPWPEDPWSAEVDSGSTTLESPIMDAGAYENLELSHHRWFFSDGGPGPDTYLVQVSPNGYSWRTVEKLTATANSWTESRYELTDHTTLSDAVRLRYVVTDDGGDSIVEGGLDDVMLSGDRWYCDPFDPPVLDPPNPVGDTLRVDKFGTDVHLTWEEPPTDSTHGRATFYRTRRSEQADTGFVETAHPRATSHIDVGAGKPSSPERYFYLVSAENSGGSE